MHNKSAESMAVNKWVLELPSVSLIIDPACFYSGFRSLVMAVAIAGVFPMIGAFGVAKTYTAVALLAWVGFGYAPPSLRLSDRLT